MILQCINTDRFNDGRLTKNKRYKVVRFAGGDYQIPVIVNDRGQPFFVSKTFTSLFKEV